MNIPGSPYAAGSFTGEPAFVISLCDHAASGGGSHRSGADPAAAAFKKRWWLGWTAEKKELSGEFGSKLKSKYDDARMVKRRT